MMISMKRRGWTSWVAALAVILPILAPLMHQPAGMAFAQRATLDLAANMCVAPGNPVAPPSDPDKAPAHKQPPCPICQTLQMLAGGYVPPSVIAAIPYGAAETVAPSTENSHFLPRRVLGGHGARAPPRSV